MSILVPMIVPKVYKIITINNWRNFITSGNNKCYGFDNDIKDGFIHLSTEKQLPLVLKKFTNQASVYKLSIDLNESKGVKWEYHKGDIYPHIYGYISLIENITDIEEILLF